MPDSDKGVPPPGGFEDETLSPEVADAATDQDPDNEKDDLDRTSAILLRLKDMLMALNSDTTAYVFEWIETLDMPHLFDGLRNDPELIDFLASSLGDAKNDGQIGETISLIRTFKIDSPAFFEKVLASVEIEAEGPDKGHIDCDSSLITKDAAFNLLLLCPQSADIHPSLKWENIEHLVLWNYPFSFLPPEIGCLTNLKILDLGEGKLTELPEEIGELTQLETLDIHLNDLTEFPPAILRLINLKYFDISENHIVTIPPGITALKDIEHFDVAVCGLTQLPPEVWKLSKTKTLSVSGNNIDTISPQIGQLGDLESLSIWGMDWTELPDEIWESKTLSALILGRCKFKQLPPQILDLSPSVELKLDEYFRGDPMLDKFKGEVNWM
jgi:Leucine-rich repeat (LRR) protein